MRRANDSPVLVVHLYQWRAEQCDNGKVSQYP